MSCAGQGDRAKTGAGLKLSEGQRIRLNVRKCREHPLLFHRLLETALPYVGILLSHTLYGFNTATTQSTLDPILGSCDKGRPIVTTHGSAHSDWLGMGMCSKAGQSPSFPGNECGQWERKALSGSFLVIRYAESCWLPSPQLGGETEPRVAEEEKESPDNIWISRALQVTDTPTLPSLLGQCIPFYGEPFELNFCHFNSKIS